MQQAQVPPCAASVGVGGAALHVAAAAAAATTVAAAATLLLQGRCLCVGAGQDDQAARGRILSGLLCE